MLRIEVGKKYLNEAGEVRLIVDSFDDGPYIFIDHLSWTYTEDGIYDLHDHRYGVDNGRLIEETDGWVTKYEHEKHF